MSVRKDKSSTFASCGWTVIIWGRPGMSFDCRINRGGPPQHHSCVVVGQSEMHQGKRVHQIRQPPSPHPQMKLSVKSLAFLNKKSRNLIATHVQICANVFLSVQNLRFLQMPSGMRHLPWQLPTTTTMDEQRLPIRLLCFMDSTRLSQFVGLMGRSRAVAIVGKTASCRLHKSL